MKNHESQLYSEKVQKIIEKYLRYNYCVSDNYVPVFYPCFILDILPSTLVDDHLWLFSGC